MSSDFLMRMAVNLVIIHLPLLFPRFRHWLFTNRQGRLWDIAVYVLLLYHWVISPAAPADGVYFVFADQGSWMANFWKYYTLDWSWRMWQYAVVFTWLLGSIIIVAMMVWLGDFYPNIPKGESCKWLFIVPIAILANVGVFLNLIPIIFV